MFNVGDIVRCVDSRSTATGQHVKGLMHFQRFTIQAQTTYQDGSQSLMVKPDPKTNVFRRKLDVRGPFCSLRFHLEKEETVEAVYDPKQMGDKDDDI